MELDVENKDINTFNLDFCEELEKALKGAGGRVAAVSVGSTTKTSSERADVDFSCSSPLMSMAKVRNSFLPAA